VLAALFLCLRNLFLLRLEPLTKILWVPTPFAAPNAGGGAYQRSRTGPQHRSSYTPPAFALPTYKNKSKLVAVQVMEQYIRWHSVDALRREPHHRKFSVLLFTCPLEAGNQMHTFAAGLYWSIVTNRTVLYKYLDRDACNDNWFGILNKPGICRDANSERDCDLILARAQWIPSFDEWRNSRIMGSLLRDKPTVVPHGATHPRGINETVPQVDTYYDSFPVVQFTHRWNQVNFMDPSSRSPWPEKLLRSDWSRATNARLHSHGVNFLHGMILRYAFEMTDAIQSAIPPEAMRFLPPRPSELDNRSYDFSGEDDTVEDNNSQDHGDDDGDDDDGRYESGGADDHDNDSVGDDGEEYDEDGGGPFYTIALHSRHFRHTEDGCNIDREIHCLDQLLRTRMPPGSRCAVTVMADRSCTLSNLLPWLKKRGCDAYVARHQAQSDAQLEHGPFAGAGFYQDLALAAAVARSAVVGTGDRSSSNLVLELVQFYRTMEAWERSNDPADWTLRRTLVNHCRLRPVGGPSRAKHEGDNM
jgi:hypothetical protein